MPLKRTKIICTLGPACADIDVLAKMIDGGMDIARLNFSHGDYATHTAHIQHVRSLETALNRPLGILADLMGPRIRVGVLEAPVEIAKGDMVIFTSRVPKARSKNPTFVPLTTLGLAVHIKPGEPIMVGDGMIECVVTATDRDAVITKVVRGGTITTGRGINMPKSSLSSAAFTEKDKLDCKFALKQGVDMIALSFVRSAADIIELREFIKKYAPKGATTLPMIIAKIEHKDAVKQFTQILNVADGIMIARGDLGIEMPSEEVPLIQKRIIAQCVEAAKPVIVATQLLQSMTSEPRPTRAEVSDIANAVIDHTDACMLSEETAVGEYPVEAVEVMTRVMKETEGSNYDDVLLLPDLLRKRAPIQKYVTRLVPLLAALPQVKAILITGESLTMARVIASLRPELPMVFATPSLSHSRSACLSWGVYPLHLPKDASQDMLSHGLAFMVRRDIVAVGDTIVHCTSDEKPPYRMEVTITPRLMDVSAA